MENVHRSYLSFWEILYHYRSTHREILSCHNLMCTVSIMKRRNCGDEVMGLGQRPKSTCLGMRLLLVWKLGEFVERSLLTSIPIAQSWFHIGMLHLLLQTESVSDTRPTVLCT